MELCISRRKQFSLWPSALQISHPMIFISDDHRPKDRLQAVLLASTISLQSTEKAWPKCLTGLRCRLIPGDRSLICRSARQPGFSANMERREIPTRLKSLDMPQYLNKHLCRRHEWLPSSAVGWLATLR